MEVRRKIARDADVSAEISRVLKVETVLPCARWINGQGIDVGAVVRVSGKEFVFRVLCGRLRR